MTLSEVIALSTVTVVAVFVVLWLFELVSARTCSVVTVAQSTQSAFKTALYCGTSPEWIAELAKAGGWYMQILFPSCNQ